MLAYICLAFTGTEYGLYARGLKKALHCVRVLYKNAPLFFTIYTKLSFNYDTTIYTREKNKATYTTFSAYGFHITIEDERISIRKPVH